MWTWEEDSTNSITIFKDNVKVAEIITDYDLTEDDRRTAQHIVDGMNAYKEPAK